MDYWQRQCKLYFPPEGNYTFGSDLGRTVEDVNAYTGGWDERNTTRLIWTNGYVWPSSSLVRLRSIPLCGLLRLLIK